MANRSMQAKVERARTQVVAAGLQEFNKHDYLVAPKLTSEEVARLVAAAPLVHVVKCTSTRRVTKSLIYNGKRIEVTDTVSNAKYAWGARKGKGAGACERRLWIGKPPRL